MNTVCPHPCGDNRGEPGWELYPLPKPHPKAHAFIHPVAHLPSSNTALLQCDRCGLARRANSGKGRGPLTRVLTHERRWQPAAGLTASNPDGFAAGCPLRLPGLLVLSILPPPPLNGTWRPASFPLTPSGRPLWNPAGRAPPVSLPYRPHKVCPLARHRTGGVMLSLLALRRPHLRGGGVDSTGRMCVA